MEIKDKCVFITGGAGGIGILCAKEFLRHGAKRVVIVDQNNEAGNQAIAKLCEFGKDRAVFLCCDITNKEQFSDTFKMANKMCNGLDIVINNAGILNDNTWELMIDINFKALVRGTLLAIECMGKNNGGKGGTVLNIASIAGLKTIDCISIYSGTKYAVFGFSQGIKSAYDVTGIRILTLCPGVTQTPLVSELTTKMLDCLDPEQVRTEVGKLPKQKPEVVASAMMKMIQEANNGEAWVIEGGEPPYAVQMPHYSTQRVPK